MLILVLGYDFIMMVMSRVTTKRYTNILHKPGTIIAILIAILLYWVLRNINHFPFTLLSP
jgi:hypothetical protein